MSNRRRKSIGQRKIREALERRLERGKKKMAAKAARQAQRKVHESDRLDRVGVAG